MMPPSKEKDKKLASKDGPESSVDGPEESSHYDLRYGSIYGTIDKDGIQTTHFGSWLHIGSSNTEKNDGWPNDRLAKLESFIKENGDEGVIDYVKSLFPEIRRQYSVDIELPSRAPELWVGGKGCPESPPQFIRRVYGVWLGHGFTRAHLRELDRPLSTALDNWLRHYQMPTDLDLPTAHEAYSRRLEELQANPDKPTSMTLSEARRLVDSERKRAHRARDI